MKLSKSSHRAGRRENPTTESYQEKFRHFGLLRVPKIMATQVMEIAHGIDFGENLISTLNQ